MSVSKADTSFTLAVSAGHGYLHEPNEYGAVPPESRWYQEIVRHLGQSFDPSQIDLVVGARAATDSGHFMWCYPASIGISADLIVVELAVNDRYSLSPRDLDTSETLLRSLLSLPKNPAVIYVDSFARGPGGRTTENGGDAHKHLALRYDVPQISLRAALLTEMMVHPDLQGPFFNGDYYHVGSHEHRMMGTMVVAYLQEEACRLASPQDYEALRAKWGPDADNGHLPGMDTLGEVPLNRITEPWDRKGSPHPSAPPTCQIAALPGTPNELVPLGGFEPSGDWQLYDWQVSRANATRAYRAVV